MILTAAIFENAAPAAPPPAANGAAASAGAPGGAFAQLLQSPAARGDGSAAKEQVAAGAASASAQAGKTAEGAFPALGEGVLAAGTGPGENADSRPADGKASADPLPSIKGRPSQAIPVEAEVATAADPATSVATTVAKATILPVKGNRPVGKEEPSEGRRSGKGSQAGEQATASDPGILSLAGATAVNAAVGATATATVAGAAAEGDPLTVAAAEVAATGQQPAPRVVAEGDSGQAAGQYREQQAKSQPEQAAAAEKQPAWQQPAPGERQRMLASAYQWFGRSAATGADARQQTQQAEQEKAAAGSRQPATAPLSQQGDGAKVAGSDQQARWQTVSQLAVIGAAEQHSSTPSSGAPQDVVKRAAAGVVEAAPATAVGTVQPLNGEEQENPQPVQQAVPDQGAKPDGQRTVSQALAAEGREQVAFSVELKKTPKGAVKQEGSASEAKAAGGDKASAAGDTGSTPAGDKAGAAEISAKVPERSGQTQSSAAPTVGVQDQAVAQASRQQDAGEVSTPADKGAEPGAERREPRPAGASTARLAGKTPGVEAQAGQQQPAEGTSGTKTAVAGPAVKVAATVVQHQNAPVEKGREEQAGGTGSKELLAPQAAAQGPLNTAAAQPESRPEAPKTPLHESILSQVKDGVVTHNAKGEKEISIRLNPEELGELKIQVRMDDNRLKVEVQADNRMVKDLLMSNLDSLKDALSAKNFTMDGFNVSSGGGGSNSPLPDKGHPQQQPAPRFSRGGGYDQPAEARVNYLTAEANTLLDVRF